MINTVEHEPAKIGERLEFSRLSSRAHRRHLNSTRRHLNSTRKHLRRAQTFQFQKSFKVQRFVNIVTNVNKLFTHWIFLLNLTESELRALSGHAVNWFVAVRLIERLEDCLRIPAWNSGGPAAELVGSKLRTLKSLRVLSMSGCTSISMHTLVHSRDPHISASILYWNQCTENFLNVRFAPKVRNESFR